MSHIAAEVRSRGYEASTPVATTDAVQISVFWGDALLEVIELSPPRAFFIGDAARTKHAVDFTVPDLPDPRFALVVREGDFLFVEAPAGAEMFYASGAVAFEDAAASLGERAPLGAVPIDVHLGALRISVSLGAREARCPRALGGDDHGRPLAFFASSLCAVGALASMMAYFTPPLGLTDDEDRDHDQLILMNQYLDATAERERKEEEAAGGGEKDKPRADEDPARGEAGRIGKPDPVAHDKRGSGSEPGAVPRPAITRAEALQAAREFGLVGMLASGAAGNVAAWEDPGVGDVAASGGLFGTDLEATGMGGLALAGIGEGGGGHSNQIGIHGIGTCGGAECGGSGFGVGSFRKGPGHAPKGPQLRMAGVTVVKGGIPADVIQRIVRQSFGRFRGCYEDGLRTNPMLEGRVTARFVISRDGSVGAVQSGGSDLPDAHVVACVLRTYSSLSFPSPGEGVVTVTYPLSFSPSA
jgi:hypothetical protein